MAVSQGTKTVLDAVGSNIVVATLVDSVAATTSPAHAVLDGATALVISPATAGNQTTGNTSLASIVTNTANIPAKGSATAANSTPVTIASDQGPIKGIGYTGDTTTRPTGTLTYTAGNVITAASGLVTTKIQISRNADEYSYLLRMGLKKSQATASNGLFRIHLHNSQPTLSNADNLAWLTGSTGYVGFFDINITPIFTDAAIGYGVPGNGGAILCKPVSGQNYLYYTIEARNAYAAAASETFIPSVEVA